MNSLRATNLLLAIIAACLLAIVGKGLIPAVLPSAHAAPSMSIEGPVAAYMFACASYSGDRCDSWKPVFVQQGAVLTTEKK